MNGSDAAPVWFTSSKDDSVGGDSNGDGGASSPAPADWGTILFTNGSDLSVVDHAVIRYGGPTPSVIACDLGSTVSVSSTGKLHLANSTITDSKNALVQVDVLGAAGVAEFTHNVFGAAPCGGYMRDGEWSQNLFMGPFTGRALYSYQPAGLVMHDNLFVGQPAWNDSRDVGREYADIQNNWFTTSGVENQPTSSQNLADLSNNWWGRVLDPNPLLCTYAYPPQPSVNVTSNSACQLSSYTAANGTYVQHVLPDLPGPPQGVIAAFPTVTSELLRGSCGGRHARCTSSTGADPINTATGVFSATVTDARLPGIGLGIAASRTYNSDETASGAFGPGWSFSYGMHASVVGDDATVTTEDGAQLPFVHSAGAWRATPGVLDEFNVVAGGYELVTRDQVAYSFDAAGALTAVRDRNGQGPTISYVGGVLASISVAGRTVTVDMDPVSGFIERLTLPDGRYAQYSYTEGRLSAVRDLRGNVTNYAYDAAGRLVSVQDQTGHYVARNTFDAGTGRVIAQLDGRGNLTTLDWDGANQVATITDANGHVRKDYYSHNVLYRQQDGAGNSTYFVHDADLDLVVVVSPLGDATRLTYDGNGNLVQRDEPLAVTTKWSYNSSNDMTSSTDPRNNVTQYTYTSAGNLQTISRPAVDASGPSVTTFAYDPSGTGLVASVTDPRNKITTYEYDSQGDLVRETSPLGAVTTYSYDAAGRLTSRVEPRGNETGAVPDDFRTMYTYNGNDQIVSMSTPLGYSTSFEYDAAGNRSAVVDANAHRTDYAYDADNHLIAVTAPDATVTAYAYDGPGNVTARTDANGNVTSYVYDAADRLATVTPPSPVGVTSYTYDAASRVAAITQPGSIVSGFLYDRLGRLWVQSNPSGTNGIQYTYDKASNVTANGTDSRVYDAQNRLTSVARGSDTISYVYDKASNVVRRTYPSNLGATVVDYAFDDDGRLASVTSGRATTSYSYDSAGNLLATTLPATNAYVEQRTYDRDGRLSEVKSTNGATTLAQSTYVLDPVGSPLSIQTADQSADPNTSYVYDARDRLSRVCYGVDPCTPSAPSSIAWTYDAVGNRLSEARSGATTYSAYNAADELCWTAATSGACGAPPTGATNYSYDARGNQTAAGSSTFTYNAVNLLTGYTPRISSVSYSTTVLPGGPLGYWRLGETSGTNAADSSGNGRNGTYVGGVGLSQSSLITNDANKSVHTDGVDDKVTLPVLALANSSFTIETWVKTGTTIGGADQTIFGAFGSSSPGEALGVRVLDDGRARLSFGGADLDTAAGTIAFNNSSQHIVATYDAATDTSRIYLNGELKVSGTQGPFTSTTATANLAYSGDSANPRRYLGHLDEVAVYGRALTSREITAHYQSGSPGSTYTYDNEWKRDTSVTNGVTTTYRWDPNNALPQLIGDRNGSTILHRYVSGREPLSVTNAAGATGWYHHDGLGSTLALTSNTGVLQYSYDDEPYGTTRDERRPDAGGPTNPLQYTGQYRDPTGLYHLRARQYDTTTGRFTTRDPWQRPNTMPWLSPYQYADGQPTAMTDPSGQGSSFWDDPIGWVGKNASPLLTAASIGAYVTCPFNGGLGCSVGQAFSRASFVAATAQATATCLRGLDGRCARSAISAGLAYGGTWLNRARAGRNIAFGFVQLAFWPSYHQLTTPGGPYPGNPVGRPPTLGPEMGYSP